jgi:hypothetical protein
MREARYGIGGIRVSRLCDAGLLCEAEVLVEGGE